MKTTEIENNQIKIAGILQTTRRPGIEKLLEWMDKNGFYTAPCSGKYHLAEYGGLAKHSLNVLNIAVSLATELYTKQGKPLTAAFVDSVVICSLLHDLGKTGQYSKPNYIEDEEKGKFKGNTDLLYVPHEIRSIAIASRFIALTEEEQFAILYHNGLYGEMKSNETPLYMILHFADMWASRVIESEVQK